MYLTEELLIEWTGLTGHELSVFYLKYKQQLGNVLQTDLSYLKYDILKFNEQYEICIKETIIENLWLLCLSF